MLKHLPKKLLDKIKKTMLYSNKPVYYNRTTIERRTFNSTTPADITDLNIEQRAINFQDMLRSEHVYRVPLRYFCDTVEPLLTVTSIHRSPPDKRPEKKVPAELMVKLL